MFDLASECVNLLDRLDWNWDEDEDEDEEDRPNMRCLSGSSTIVCDPCMLRSAKKKRFQYT